MPDEHARKLTDPVPPTAYTPEELVFRWADQLEPKLNAALAEAAMARQETAAQSARIDQLQESTQKADSRLHGYIGAVEQALEDALEGLAVPSSGRSIADIPGLLRREASKMRAYMPAWGDRAALLENIADRIEAHRG